MIKFILYNSADSLPKHQWDLLNPHDIFLQSNYLKAFEKASPKSVSMYYIGVFKRDILVGVAVVQHVQLYLKDMFRNGGATCFKEFVKNALSRILKGNILVVGNLTHTGQHGIFYNKEAIAKDEFTNQVFEAVRNIQNIIKTENGKTIRLILFKDYFENDTIRLDKKTFDKEEFYKMQVQPNMILMPKDSWLSERDYVGDMTTKYRARHKRARQKKQNILTKELGIQELIAQTKTIYSLYKNVSNNAAFNTFILPEPHFLSLKESLLDNFKVFGYYLDDQLIGFYSLILNNSSLETYFLGYDSEHQHANQLYLNMLYDMASFAIANKFKTVVYARTAMEIKSSVGARPEPMFMYLKLTNRIANALLKQVFNFMNPKQEWEERHPFKKETP